MREVARPGEVHRHARGGRGLDDQVVADRAARLHDGPDGLEVLLEAGVRAVVQPGGSVRDNLVVEAAAAAGVPMYFTGTRHFAH